MLNLAYLIPNIYLFIRILQLFILKKDRFKFISIYLLVFSVYPVSNFLRDHDPAILSILAGYLLPFFLYLFLAVLSLDIILLINRLLKVVPIEKLQDISFRKYGFPAVIIISLFVVAAGIINFNTIRLSEYNITLPYNLPGTGKMRIAFVSDFHLNERTPAGFVRSFAGKVEEADPDLLLFGGDIVEGNIEDKNMVLFESIINGLKVKYGKYGILGNHEHYSGHTDGTFFERAGIVLLIDTVIKIDGSFYLAGRNDSHREQRKTVEDLLLQRAAELPVILLDHRPTDMEAIDRVHIDIALSGHTHNGQLFPINLITGKIYELSWGHLKKGNTHFFVSSGIRLWGPPVRTAGKSEIMVINIKQE